MRGWRPEQIITAIGRGGCDDCEAIVEFCSWCRLWNWMCRPRSMFRYLSLNGGVNRCVFCMLRVFRLLGSRETYIYIYIWSRRHYCFLRHFTSLGWNGDGATRVRSRYSSSRWPIRVVSSTLQFWLRLENRNIRLQSSSSFSPRNKFDSALLHFIGTEDLILTEITILDRTEHNGV